MITIRLSCLLSLCLPKIYPVIKSFPLGSLKAKIILAIGRKHIKRAK